MVDYFDQGIFNTYGANGVRGFELLSPMANGVPTSGQAFLAELDLSGAIIGTVPFDRSGPLATAWAEGNPAKLFGAFGQNYTGQQPSGPGVDYAPGVGVVRELSAATSTSPSLLLVAAAAVAFLLWGR